MSVRFRTACLLLLFPLGSLIAAQDAPPPSSIWNGSYTDEQAMRGSVTFDNNCAECHMADLSGRAGPPLKGEMFLDRWRGKSVGSLLEKIQTTMPADWRTQLTDVRALGVVAFLLQKNGFPAGPRELDVATAGALTLDDHRDK